MLHPKQQHIVDVYGKQPKTLDEIAEACIAVVNKKDTVLGFAWDIKYDPEVGCSHSAPVNGKTNWGGAHDGPRNYPGFSGRFWIRYAADCHDTFGWSRNMDATLTHTGSGGIGAYNGLWTEISSAAYQTRRSVNPTDYRHHGEFIYEYPRPECFSTDYRFFLDDFPGLCTDPGVLLADEIIAFEEEQDRQETWHVVQSRYFRRAKFDFRHQFSWEDPATKAADDAFVKKFNKSRKVPA